jgi:hypothetical protein
MNLQIPRNIENFEQVTLNKASNNIQEFEYLRINGIMLSVIVTTFIKYYFSLRF